MAQQAQGRALGLYGKIAAGGTSDRQTFAGTANLTTIKGYEFSAGITGRWTFTSGSNLIIPFFNGAGNAVGTAVTVPAINAPNSIYSLVVGAGASASSTFSGFSSGPTGGEAVQPTTPNSSTALSIMWGTGQVEPTTYGLTYADSGANNRACLIGEFLFQPGPMMVATPG
jgi:hypothetical protein